ncbi:M23 family metallopeptidase [Thermomonospora umbrina]|uniref:M23 family metallopeptidase n=1 Tax=Thermomonospora umbrina TaxID=111806 RepID=UPI001B885D61|nr:M23 family metallopeptidase [Thermomonospora umbrina]
MPGHRGVDLDAAPGQAVYAAARGRVSFAGRIAGYGVVAITHGALRTTYLPVEPAVHVGQAVTSATGIGTVQPFLGHCGHRHCLHWGVLRGTQYVDPLALLSLRLRLLPFWPGSDDGLISLWAGGRRPVA